MISLFGRMDLSWCRATSTFAVPTSPVAAPTKRLRLLSSTLSGQFKEPPVDPEIGQLLSDMRSGAAEAHNGDSKASNVRSPSRAKSPRLSVEGVALVRDGHSQGRVGAQAWPDLEGDDGLVSPHNPAPAPLGTDNKRQRRIGVLPVEKEGQHFSFT